MSITLSNSSTKENVHPTSNEVLCNICYERLDQGNSSSNTLIQYRKCRLKFSGKLLSSLRSYYWHSLSQEQCRKYVGNIGKRWKMDRYKVCLNTHDVPALRRLLWNAKHRTWSIKMLLEMVQLSLDGNYLAKGYSDGSSEVTTRSFATKLPPPQWRRKGWGYPTLSVALWWGTSIMTLLVWIAYQRSMTYTSTSSSYTTDLQPGACAVCIACLCSLSFLRPATNWCFSLNKSLRISY